MSRLFNWKQKLLGRKTPEPKDNVAIKIQEHSGHISHELPKNTRVRFDEHPTIKDIVRPEQNEHFEYSRPQSLSGPVVIVNPTSNTPLYQNTAFNTVQQLGTIQEIDFEQGVPKKDFHPSDYRAAEWKYADDVKVTIAPIAESEIDDGLPRQGQRDSTRASTVLQSLREQADHIEYNEKRRQNMNSVNPNIQNRNPSPISDQATMNRSLQIPRASPIQQPSGRLSLEPQPPKREWDEMSVVFLQANDEVKRVVMPPRIDAMEQVKMAFVRVFPHITRGYIEQPFVRIYIQDPIRGIFYELDDLREIRNKTVLRLREQRAGGVASPVRHLDHPDYHSEAEYEDSSRGNRFVSLARPASAMARARDPYYDSYSSDASDSRANSVTRSGSATPIIDREARDRMETMERQLAGLSSLVHTALVSKGMPEAAQRDMAELRKQIFALHPDAERCLQESMSDAARDSPRVFDPPQNTVAQKHLSALRERVAAASTDCKQLKNTAQANATEARNLLQEASREISRIVAEQISANPSPTPASTARRSATPQPYHPEDGEERKLKEEHETRTKAMMDNLTSFEQNVETLRRSVLNANRKLRMSEVEQLTEQLTQIGRTAASIKTDFPVLQTKIETRVKQDMERVVRDEKYIREETQTVDQSLRRCKALANIMVTMKKLAMVQDPALSRPGSRQKSSTNVSLTLPPPVPTSALPSLNDQVPPPPAPPGTPQIDRQSDAPPQTSTLDSVLDEVQSVPSVPHPPAIASTMHPAIQTTNSQTSTPPRPPSRTAVSDVRAKFKQPPELPQQIRSLMEDVRRASPALDLSNNERTIKSLDERQRELAEKQRQLTTQFQQMQSVPSGNA